MADDENQEVEEQPKVAEESGGVLDLNTALQQVLKKAAVQPDGLARGLREAVKALDRKVVSCRLFSLLAMGVRTCNRDGEKISTYAICS